MGLRIYTRTEKPSASKELCTAEGPHQLYWVRIWSAHRMLRTQQFLWRLVPWHSLWGQFLSSYPMLAVQIIATKVNFGLSDSRLWLPGLGPELVHAVAGSSVLSSVSNSTAIPWAPGKHVGHSAWPWSNPLKAFIDFDTSDTFWSFVLNFFLLFFFLCVSGKQNTTGCTNMPSADFSLARPSRPCARLMMLVGDVKSWPDFCKHSKMRGEESTLCFH